MPFSGDSTVPVKGGFDRVAILTEQGVCDYLDISEAAAPGCNSRYSLGCVSLTSAHCHRELKAAGTKP